MQACIGVAPATTTIENYGRDDCNPHGTAKRSGEYDAYQGLRPKRTGLGGSASARRSMSESLPREAPF